MPWQRLLCLIVALAAGALSVSSLGTERAVGQDPATATAHVVRVDSFRRAPDTITVSFETRPGSEVQAEIEDDGPQVGDVVEVEYNRNDPSKARIAGSHGQLLGGLLYGSLAVVGLVGTAFPRLNLGLRRRRRGA